MVEKRCETKKIVHVLADEPRGGVGAFLLNTLSDDHAYEIVEYTLQEDSYFNQEMAKRGIRLHSFPRHTEVYHYNQAVREFYKTRAKEIALVHVHSTAVAPFHLFWAKFYGIQTRTIHLHSNYLKGISLLRKWRNQSILSFIFSLATDIVTCGEKVASLVPKSRSFTILPNTIRVPDFRFDEAKRNVVRQDLGLQDKIVIGIVGRISKEKNHIFLLDIFKSLPDQYVLVVIGDGPLEASLKEKCRQDGLSNILFLGRQSNIADYLHALDALAMPSFVEGFPLVALEAQANGLPCFFSEVVDRSVQVTDYVTFNSIDDSSQWLQSFQTFRPVSTETRMEANQRVFQTFDIHVGREKLGQFYKKLLEK
ncbi:TPA: glycosyltransferase [Streptococcus suis]